MKKQLISLCCFLALATFAQAQNSGQFGLRVGVSLGHYSLTSNGMSFGFSDQLLPFGRLTYALPSKSRTTLQLESGVGMRSLNFWLPGDIGFPSAPSITFTNLEAGLLLRHTIALPGAASIQLIGGPTASYAIAGATRMGDSRMPLDLPSSGINRLDVGFDVGAGVNFGYQEQYGLELRYGRGFNSLVPEEDGTKLIHQQFSLGLNYRF